MSKPKISVILPVYNTSKYLEETLMSLLNQTIIEDIEVLMIDDGSTDESRAIIEKYALDYNNFYAFHKENEGQAIAGNYGLELAKGDYIHFMDSDDYINCDMYEKLYDIALSTDCDMVVANALRFNRYDFWESAIFEDSFKGLSESGLFNGIDEHPSFLLDSAVWNKLYKKEFLLENNLKFIENNVLYEDRLFSFECYFNADSFYFLNECLYYWRYRPDASSITQLYSTLKNFKDRIVIFQIIKGLIAESNVDSKLLTDTYERWLVHDLGMHIDCFYSFPSETHEKLVNDILDIIEPIPQEIKENLNSYYTVIYKMIENRDFEGLLYLTPLKDTLMDNPDFELKLDDDYSKWIDFDRDCGNEKLFIKKTEMRHDDENILIDFNFKINYLSDKYSYEINASLIDENGNEDMLDIKNNTLILPFDAMKSKGSFYIKMKFSNHLFSKEIFLRNNKGKAY